MPAQTASTQRPDSVFIQHMFDRLAGRYDLFNRLTSLGLDRRWRKAALTSLQGPMRVLDLGCGTGDVCLEAARRLEGAGEVVGLDFSAPMLAIAEKKKQKLPAEAARRIRFVLGKAEDLPLDDRPYDLVVSGFVLRNLYENIDSILGGVYRSLKEGGRVSFVDITEPPARWKLKLWRFYMSTTAAFYGKLLFGRDYPVSYLTDSAQRFVKPADFILKLQDAGFKEVRTRQFLFGVIVLYQAVKPGAQ